MKDLTHYFTSPNEEKTSNNSSSVLLENSCNNQSPVTKKKKVNLSISKPVNKEEKETLSENATESHDVEIKPQGSTSKPSRKRKSVEETQDKMKKIVSKKIKLSRSKSKLTKDDSLCESYNETSENMDAKKIDNVIAKNIIESNSNSCDEFLVKTKKKKFNLISESDDECTTSLKVELPEPSISCTEQSLDCAKSPNNARNSLLGYFNKVDKKVAIKDEKPEKIKVKAQIHSPPTETGGISLPPSGVKLLSSSNGNLPKKKLKKSKQKQINNFDAIEVISSEDVTEENRPLNMELSQKNLSQEEICNDSKKLVNSGSVKPTNIASIFMPKKVENKNESNIENTTQSKEVPKEVENKNKSNIENTTQDKELISEAKVKNLNKEKVELDVQEKQRKSLRVKKSSKKKSELDGQNEFENDDCKEKDTNTTLGELNSKKSKQNKKKKSETITKDNLTKTINNPKNKNGFVKCVSLSQNSEDIECSETTRDHKNSIKEVCKIDLSSENNTQVESKLQEDSVFTKTINTPKQKSHTINGYFTQKSSDGDSFEKKNCSENGVKQKKSPTPWIMKVRLSASKSQPGVNDSDEEEKDSTQAEKQEISSAKTEDNIPEPKEVEDDIVIVVPDEDEESKSSQEICPKRTRLSAKKLSYVDEDKSEPSKLPVKIWPFFQKGGARQAKDTPPVDEEKLKAKIMFLESGVPEVLKRKVESEKSDTPLGVPAPFPTVSHVTQSDEAVRTEETSTVSLLPNLRCPTPPPVVPAWTSLTSTVDSDEPEIPVFERSNNAKAYLEKIKEQDSKTELKTLYKRLKEYKINAESDIWTEVYKPTKSTDIVGNTENIKKLKAWLETFKTRRREGSGSSGDEFVDDDSDGEGSCVNNLAVVSGPYGCGKTCAVYAIAAELDYKVLEMNASCNRSGKRILAEFSESTQSHQVERANVKNDIFNNQGSGKAKKKKKLKQSKEAKSEKTSLILVEDADLLFTDADDGFMPALSSLAATAKRPLILVTNQIKNPHLDRFQSCRPLQLTFSKPKPSKLELWLRLVGLVEGVKVEADQASSLVAWSGCDVRRALLQLQLMVHSNNSELSVKQTESRLWWQWPLHRQLHYELPTLLEAEEPPAPQEMTKDQRLRELAAISQTTSRLAYLDVLSARYSQKSQRLGEQQDPCPTSWVAQYADSTVQTQCQLAPVEDLGADLSAWLADTVAREGSTTELTTSVRPAGQTAQEARWLSILRQSEQMFLSGVSSTMLSNHEAVACEYLPTLRQLGRAEQVRLANYSRRANRFFNYLQGLGVHASKSYVDFMCDVFS